MTLQQLRYLIAVAEHGSLTAAAEVLFVVQPALSRALQALERELKVTLFARNGRGLVLTNDGEQVVRLARTVVDGVRAIEDTARGEYPAPTSDEGVVTVATCGSLAVEFVSGPLPAYSKRFPRMSLRVVVRDNRDTVFEDLRTGEVDAAVIDLPVPRDLLATRIGAYEVVLVSPKSVSLPDPLPWEALDGLPMILPPRGTPRRTDMEVLFGMAGASPRAVIESDERGAWVSCVLAGHCSMLAYDNLAQRIAPLVSVRSFSPPLIRAIGLVRARRTPSPQAQAMFAIAQRWGAQEHLRSLR